jgi:hypothetical protein
MRIRAPLLAGGSGLGLLLLALAGPSDEPRGGVVLNPDPPQPPRWGLKWDAGELPEPTVAAAEVPPPSAPCDFGDSMPRAADSGGGAPLSQDPYAG